MSFARWLDRLAQKERNNRENHQRGDNRGDADIAVSTGMLRVTSVYTPGEAALVSKVARRYHVSESKFQWFAVLVVSQARGH